MNEVGDRGCRGLEKFGGRGGEAPAWGLAFGEEVSV